MTKASKRGTSLPQKVEIIQRFFRIRRLKLARIERNQAGNIQPSHWGLVRRLLRNYQNQRAALLTRHCGNQNSKSIAIPCCKFIHLASSSRSPGMVKINITNTFDFESSGYIRIQLYILKGAWTWAGKARNWLSNMASAT